MGQRRFPPENLGHVVVPHAMHYDFVRMHDAPRDLTDGCRPHDQLWSIDHLVVLTRADARGVGIEDTRAESSCYTVATKMRDLPALPQPRSLDAWLALPELPMGEYEVFNVGSTPAPLTAVRARGLPDLPPSEDNEPDMLVSLPNVEVIEGARPVMYRLPLIFGAVVRQIYEDAGGLYAVGRRLLPTRFLFGRLPDGSAFAKPVPQAAHDSN